MSGQAGRHQFHNLPFLWLALALSALTLGAHATVVAALLRHAHDNRDPGFRLALKADGWYVSQAEGAAGAVQPGDGIVAVNNTPARIDISPTRQLSSCQVCTLRIQRGGRVQDVELKIAEQRNSGRAATDSRCYYPPSAFTRCLWPSC